MSNRLTLPSIWNIPYQRNPYFTGRDDILAQLHTSLQVENNIAALTQPHGLSGLGGIGKTQTAIEYAYRYHAEYRVVLWVSADSAGALISSFVTIAHLLQLPEKDEQDQRRIIESVMRWLRLHTHWLLIFDNVDDLAVIEPFIPRASRGHILLTTRLQAMGGIAQGIQIGRMHSEIGALFLLRRASILALDASLDDAPADNRVLSVELTQLMDGLPLALDQAGAYMKEVPCTLAAYLDLYRKRHSGLLKIRGDAHADYPDSVATTWSLSFEKVSQAQPAASELLQLSAFFYSEAIPEEIITDGASDLGPLLQPVATDPIRLNSTFKELLRFSLLQREPDARTFTIHRLVQAVLRDRMDANAQQQYAERVVRAVNDTFPGVEFATWQNCQRLILQAQKCATLVEEWNMEFSATARLLNQAAAYLRVRGQYAQAEPLYLQALTTWSQVLGLYHPHTAACINNLALLYNSQGKREKAEQFYLAALAIWEQVLGPEDPNTAIGLHNLADLYRAQGKYEEAEQLYQRALTIREQVLGPEHPGTATTLNSLAALYNAQGKYNEAEQLYQQALAIREKILGL